MIALSNGCICCTLRTELVQGIKDMILGKPHYFDLLIIEATGIAEPLPIATSIHFTDEETGFSLSEIIEIHTMMTFVDASRLLAFFESDDFVTSWQGIVDEKIDEDDDRTLCHLVTDQIECADVIVVNKIDLVRKRIEEIVCESDIGCVDVLLALQRYVSPVVAVDKAAVAEEPKSRDCNLQQIVEKNVESATSEVHRIIKSLNSKARIVDTCRSVLDPSQYLFDAEPVFSLREAQEKPLWFQEMNRFADHVPETLEFRHLCIEVDYLFIHNYCGIFYIRISMEYFE